MRLCLCVGAIALLLGSAASAQTSQVGKRWDFPRSGDQASSAISRVESRDGLTNSKYLQKLEQRIAAASGVPSVTTHLTLGAPWYAFLAPDNNLYISAGLILQTSKESQLAGLIAHMLAHSSAGKLELDQCILGKNYMPISEASARTRERKATLAALSYMKTARFEPSSLLDILSTVSYERPLWSSAINSSDVLQLRVPLDAEAPPKEGYRVDSSEYVALRAELSPVELLRMSVKPAAR